MAQPATKSAKLAAKTPGKKRTNATPKTASAGTTNLPTTKSGSGNASNLEVDSASVATEEPSQATKNKAPPGSHRDGGPGGLADRPVEALGIMTRPSSRESEQIQPDLDNRFAIRILAVHPQLTQMQFLRRMLSANGHHLRLPTRLNPRPKRRFI